MSKDSERAAYNLPPVDVPKPEPPVSPSGPTLFFEKLFYYTVDRPVTLYRGEEEGQELQGGWGGAFATTTPVILSHSGWKAGRGFFQVCGLQLPQFRSLHGYR